MLFYRTYYATQFFVCNLVPLSVQHSFMYTVECRMAQLCLGWKYGQMIYSQVQCCHPPPGWTPPGKRQRGRPKMTWRQTVIAELTDMGLSWGEAQASAKDRTLWRKIVVALCPTGDEEEK